MFDMKMSMLPSLSFLIFISTLQFSLCQENRWCLEKIQQNHQLVTIEEWGPLFRVSFDLMIHSNVDSTWSSVLAFRGNGAVDDSSQYGDRAPAIFYNKAGYLHFTNAVNGNRNYHFNFGIKLNKLYQIEIAQEEENGKVFYTVKVDGVTIKSVENTDARTFKDVRVFAGDNFYDPADGSYSNLIWERFVKVFSHDITGGLFQSDEEALNKNADDPSAKLFSKLDHLDIFRREDGKLHFKIVYPLLGGSNEWLQLSNPATSNKIEGYEAVNLDFKFQGQLKPWGGLGLCTGQKKAFICDTPTTGYWFMCVGCQSMSNTNKIPGPRDYDEDYSTTQVELYVLSGCPMGQTQLEGRCVDYMG